MKYKRLITLTFVLLATVSLWLPRETKALNVWGDWFDRTVGQKGFNDLGFGRNDPRTIVANVINIALGLLGVAAIVLIMYGGFVWMTAGGDPEKIGVAKKILVSASIGLLIILSAWALAIYVLSRLWLATGARVTAIEGMACTPNGITTPCGCGGIRTCTDNQWGACIGSDCTGGGGRRSCDANTLTPVCDADNAACSGDEYCNPTDCFCTKRGGYGDNCDQDSASQTCQADNTLCQQFLTCDKASCTCLGEPVIESVSPAGGFCDGAPATTCASNADCAAFNPATCNVNSPNGAVGNLVTISGRYFLPYQAGVSKVLFWDGSGFNAEAQLAVGVNPACSESWSDSQIIAVVPASAQSGAIEVVAANGADSTDNNRGPAVNDFILNNLKRPGLCNLNPVVGKLDTLLTYSGVGLSGVEAYFGSARQNLKANNSQFGADLNGTAQAPNLVAGETTTFVRAAAGPLSNFLRYTQQAQAGQGPQIISFEPTTGAPGQYVTISGSGFGNAQTSGRVLFGETEADYNFPAVCAQSVWRDSEIIVKVPKGLADGNYKLAVEVNRLRAESTDSFLADKNAALKPGLCKISPLFGQINDEINFWGEYFGNLDVNSQIVFQPNLARRRDNKICLGGNNDGQACNAASDCDSNQCQSAIMFWAADPTVKSGAKSDLATTKVPAGTITGPLKIGKGQPAAFSNSLNFTVGACSQDSQCGGANVCCSSGTPLAGSCRESAAECYGSTDSCVYEWQFDTGSKNNCPPDKPNACQDGSCCRSDCALDSTTGLTTCLDNASCAGYNGNLCFDTLLCPNSPGNCSFNKDVTTIGATCDCNLLGYRNFQYDSQFNLCVGQQTCSLKEKTVIAGRTWDRFCANYNGTARWEINTKQTCPDGFTPTATGSNTCVDLNSSCELCPDNKFCDGGTKDGQLCAGDSDCNGARCRRQALSCTNIGGAGKCTATWPICPNNFTCQNSVCTRQAGSCECCCDKTQNKPDKTNPACCAPLTCDNSCGAGGNFGYCSGCANVGTTQAEHDAACNCTGSTGKFCDTSVQGGACRDCSQIGNLTDCSGHESCCVNAKQGNACTGVADSRFFEGALAYCAYFDCGTNCAAPTKDGAYDSAAKCQNKCNLNCDGSDQLGCQANNSKCPAGRTCDATSCLCVPSDISCDLLNNLPGCQADQSACPKDRPICDGTSCLCVPDVSCDNDQNLPGCQAKQDLCPSDRPLCDANTCLCQPADFGPQVEAVLPPHDSTGVCRNNLIRAKFNTKMDRPSLSGNVIVVGDYGDGLCPDNTTLLAGAVPEQSANFLVRLWQQIRNLLARFVPWLADKSAAAAANRNFCAVTGQVVSQNIVEGSQEKTYADFKLSAPLGANIKYYVIIKGDDTVGGGVRDINKLAFKGANQTDTDTFNGLTYPNAYIWNFTTGSDLCYLDRVVITPGQHLFQKPQDDYPFFADAVAANGAVLSPLPGIYDWQWSWRSDNSSVASVVATANQATVTSGSKRDAETFVYARAAITADTASPLSTEGTYKEARAKIIVFICANPWPAVTDPDVWPIRWQDQGDNCDVCTDPVTGRTKPCSPADCLNNNFEFYYCRDQGGVGTVTDFPSLTLDPPIRGRYKYLSNDVWVDVLKDFYFFRINLPAPPAGLTAVLTGAKKGGEVKLTWPTGRDLTYKIYYGTASGQYTDYVEAGTNDNVIIGGLSNNQDYYFALTATSIQQVESPYAEEVSLKVEDKIAPDKPAGTGAKVIIAAADKKITAVWNQDASEAIKYQLGYGPNPAPAVTLNIGSVTTYTLNKLNNLGVQDYYLQLTALDAYNNKSEAVKLLCAKGCTDQCDCQLQ